VGLKYIGAERKGGKGLAETIETPALVIDPKILRNDLTILRTIADRAKCKFLYSPKASSLATILANVAPLVDGFACSSPFELQLVDRVCDETAPLHLVSPLIIARQSGWERRVNQDESLRPSGIIDAGRQNGKSDCVGKV
jgi:hypothetical protein